MVEIVSFPSEMKSDDPRTLPIDTVIIHSMYNPSAEDPFSAEACKKILDDYEVSAHYIIDRLGKIFQLVEENYMAWHAGRSQMPQPDNRERVNGFSVGIELVADKQNGMTERQYSMIAELVVDIMTRHAIHFILGHNDIAGQNIRPDDPKTDPWNFDWVLFAKKLNKLATERGWTFRFSRDE